MFVKSSSPFKLCYYKKGIIGDANKSHLVMSFTCVHYPHVMMVGALFEERLVLSKKDTEGNFHIGDKTFVSKNKDMSLHNFVENFKESDGIDFVIIRNPLYFLFTRQQNRTINIFMTNGHNYVSVFTDPSAFFEDHESETYNYAKEFNLSVMGECRVDRDESPGGSPDEEAMCDVNNDIDDGRIKGPSMDSPEIKDRAFVVDVNESITEQDFKEFLKENEVTSVIRLGRRKGRVVEFHRYPLIRNSNNVLLKIVKRFSASDFDLIEILGKTKIAGTFNSDGQVIWYAEVPHDDGNESSYIEGLGEIFGEFAPEDSEAEE